MYVVARIGKPHGLRGEVTVQTHTDDPSGRFVEGAEFSTEPAEAGPLRIRSVRVHQGIYLLAFDRHTDRTAAEALRGLRLIAGVEPADEGSDSDDDAWYPEEIVGFAVVDTDGSPVGTVADLHTRAVQDLLEVNLEAGGTALVPFVDEIVPDVDEEHRRVVIDPPPGLLDLQE